MKFADGTLMTTSGFTINNNIITYNKDVNIIGGLKLGTNSLFLGSETSGNAGIGNYIYTDNGPLNLQKTSSKEVVIGGGVNGTTINQNVIFEVFGQSRFHHTIQALDICVTPNAFCDYVFEKGYKLQPLTEVEKFINENKHLPEVPSEKVIKENGMKLNEIILVQMKKIEELTLYAIEQEKRIKALESKLSK